MTSLQLLHPGAFPASELLTQAGNSLPDRRPHVLLILDQFPETSGGAERIALRQAALLPRFGYRVSLLTFFAHPSSSCLLAPPCPTYLLPLTSTHNRAAWHAAGVLRAFLADEEVRIVQTFFESSDLWAGMITKIASDAKLVWSRRDMGILRSGKHHVAYRMLSRMPDAVLAVSEQVRRHAIEVDGIAPERVETIYNGLDLAQWPGDAGARPEGGPVITTVGNLRRVKGHDVFLEAAAIVSRKIPGARFTVGGDVLEPAYFAALQQQVTRLGLEQQVSFVGGVRDLPRHLAGADLFVLPSRSEGFSNAILEAMAASLPVVATDVGGNAEAVRTGVTGLIVPPENAEALAAAMLAILSDPQRAAAMGAAGKRVVAENFTTDAMMRRIVGLYDRLLA